MSDDLRIEAVGFQDHYCAVYRRPGRHDEFLVDDTGTRRRFETAAAAIYAARSAMGISLQSIEDEAAAWMRRKRQPERAPFPKDVAPSSSFIVVRKKRRLGRKP